MGDDRQQLRITRFVCKVKMSQDKDQRSREQVLDALRGPGSYGNPALAAEMQRALASHRSNGGESAPRT